MIDPRTIDEIRNRLWRVTTLAKEIEDVPNMPQDMWTMRGIDKKCREIQDHCQWIAYHLPSPPPPGPYDTGPGWGGSGSGSGWGTGPGW